MPKDLSLKLKKDFQRLFKSGIRKSSKHFTIIFIDSISLKFAFIVDAKTMPTAAHRNYSKRIMREIVRTYFLTSISKPLHIGIRPLIDLKNLVKEIGFEKVENELIELLKTIDFSRPAIRK